MNISYSNNRFIIDSRITNDEQWRIVHIFDTFGSLKSKISIEYDRWDDKDIVYSAPSSACIIWFYNKEKILKYYDLNGDFIREAQIINFGSSIKSNFEIKSDSNQNIYFFDKYSKILYISD